MELRNQYEVGNRDREEALQLLAAAQRKEEETAKDFTFRINALVKLAYPTFDDASKAIHEKDAFIRGLHPDMQMKLKTLTYFATLTMPAILDHTVRLEVAGVKSVSKKLKEEMNSIDEQSAPATGACCSSGEQKLLDRLTSLEQSIAKMNVVDTRGGASSSPQKGKQGKNKKPCLNCSDSSHLVKQCPKRFCAACGGTGHDWWSKTCPKYGSR